MAGEMKPPSADFGLSYHVALIDAINGLTEAVRELSMGRCPDRVPNKRKGRSSACAGDPAVLVRRKDTARVIAEIRRRHAKTGRSYAKVIREMKGGPVWSARMRHMSEASWKTEAIRRRP